MCSCLNSLLFALILLSLVIFRSCLQVAGHPNNQSLVLLVIVKTYFVFVSTCTLRKAVCIVLMDPRMRSLDGTHHITRTEMPAWEGQYSCPHAPPSQGLQQSEPGSLFVICLHRKSSSSDVHRGGLCAISLPAFLRSGIPNFMSNS